MNNEPTRSDQGSSAAQEREDVLGCVQWHSSDEDSGPDVGISIGLGHGRMLWCGEISRQRHADAGKEAAALGDDFGWWIILYGPPGETRVIAKCLNCYDARDMIEHLAVAMRPRPFHAAAGAGGDVTPNNKLED
jgi:hypothetical protein